MPTYGYQCSKCKKSWSQFLLVEDREKPLNEACPKCSKAGCITRDWMGTDLSIASDATLTPNKATGGRWNELMSKMKSGLPERYARKLDRSNNMTGRSWKG